MVGSKLGLCGVVLEAAQGCLRLILGPVPEVMCGGAHCNKAQAGVSYMGKSSGLSSLWGLSYFVLFKLAESRFR